MMFYWLILYLGMQQATTIHWPLQSVEPLMITVTDQAPGLTADPILPQAGMVACWWGHDYLMRCVDSDGKSRVTSDKLDMVGMQGQGQTPGVLLPQLSGEVDPPHEVAKPEPMVQPAQLEQVPNENAAICFQDNRGCEAYDANGQPVSAQVWLEGGVEVRRATKLMRWTCDPERVLLTTESGKKLCIKFEESK